MNQWTSSLEFQSCLSKEALTLLSCANRRAVSSSMFCLSPTLHTVISHCQHSLSTQCAREALGVDKNCVLVSVFYRVGSARDHNKTVAVTEFSGGRAAYSAGSGVSVKMSPLCKELGKEKLALGGTEKFWSYIKKLSSQTATTQAVLHGFRLLQSVCKVDSMQACYARSSHRPIGNRDS